MGLLGHRTYGHRDVELGSAPSTSLETLVLSGPLVVVEREEEVACEAQSNIWSGAECEEAEGLQ